MRRLPVVLLAMSLCAPALAQDWPVFRHDARRTAATAVPTPIDRPAVAFRTYLGGALEAEQLIDHDVDGDGRAEIVYVSGGRVVAKRGNNLAVWESEALPVDRLWGPVDLDEDGSTDLLLTRTWPAPSQLVIVSSRDGRVLWRMPPETTDWFGGVRVGDVDGDGHLDLYVGSGMCGTGVSGPPGTAFSFCDEGGCSYARPRTLWNLPAGPGGCGAGGALGDTDGDGAVELVSSWQYTELPIYAGPTGTPEGALPAFATGTYDRAATTVFLRDIDADPALEIVAWTNSFNAGHGARRVAVFDHDGAGYRLLWEVAGTDRANDRVVIDAPGSLADLDGDGTLELAVASRIGGVWATTLRDAVSGTVLATLPDAAVLSAVVDVTGDGRPELLATIGNQLAAFELASDGTVRERWRLADRFVVRVSDAARRPFDPTPTRAFTMQLDDDPAAELLLGERGSSGGLVALHAYDAEAAPALLGTYRAPDGVSILVAAEVAPMTRDFAQPVVATSDGYLLILDRSLAVTNRVVSGEFQEPGMRVGGFYTGAQGPSPTALVGAIDSGAPRIVVPDSRGALVFLDASAASPVVPPRWDGELAGVRWASLLDLDGSAPLEVVAYQGQDLVVRRAGGAESRQRATEDRFAADPLPLSAPGGPRIAITRTDAGANLIVALYDTALAELWSSVPRLPGWGAHNHGLSSIADRNGDGTEDVITVINSVHALSGASGAVVWDNGPFMAGGDPMVVGDTVFAHGAWQPTRLVQAGGATRWTLAGDTQVNAYGALVRCDGADAFVAGESGSAALFAIRASDGAPLARRVVAGGLSYAPDAVPASVTPGIATNVTALASLDGAPAVLVGSTDGHLYALEPCTLALRWSVDLRYPVGEPIAADLDGDGDGEILVSVADGYLYGLVGAAYEAPEVRDIDPSAPSVDVDEIDTADTLHAAWSAVPGATGYLVSVYSEYGTEVRFPNTIQVGAVTQAEIPMLQLAQGARYVVAVQPIGPDGPGLEGRSDGVRLVDTRAPEARVTVAPDPSWPVGGVVPRVASACIDRVGLARMQVEIERDGAVIAVLADRTFSGHRTTSGNDPFEDTTGVMGTYLARVICTDTSGNEASATATFTLDPSAQPMDAGAPQPDAGTAPAATGGCGCRAGGEAPAAWPLLLAVVALVARRRRARTSSSARTT